MAYDFNGTNQYLSTASAPVTATPLTLACWFNVGSLNPPHGEGQVLVSLCPTSTGLYSRFILHIRTNTFLAATSSDASAVSVRAETTIAPALNTWQHGCAVFSSNVSRTIYLNGSNSVNNTTSNSPNGADITGAYVAGQFVDVPASRTVGRIAEVGIWSDALTADEVASLADGMTCEKVRPQSIVFYSPLVRNLQDISGGLTITNNNGATAAPQTRVYA